MYVHFTKRLNKDKIFKAIPQVAQGTLFREFSLTCDDIWYSVVQ
jgi:hypothetical protein